jgi:predicted transcriptional regulator
MYIGDQASFRGSGEGAPARLFPREVELLYRREREIAAVVYRIGLATAADVQAELSRELSNPAVRSMLNRLVAKGILTRTRCGRFGTFVYGPALTPATEREAALRRFADDFYAGSLSSLARAIADLFASESHSLAAQQQARRRA